MITSTKYCRRGPLTATLASALAYVAAWPAMAQHRDAETVRISNVGLDATNSREMQRLKRVMVLAATAFVVSAFVSTAHAQQSGDPPSSTVRFPDLDLSNESGRATLEARTRHAIEIICGVRPTDQDLVPGWSHCRATAKASADTQLSELFRGQYLAERSTARRSPRRLP